MIGGPAKKYTFLQPTGTGTLPLNITTHFLNKQYIPRINTVILLEVFRQILVAEKYTFLQGPGSLRPEGVGEGPAVFPVG